MGRKLFMLAVTLLVAGSMAWAADSWTGTVSDSHCGATHATASAAAATCVAKCVKGGAKYVLVSGDKVYAVAPQAKFKDFAGKSVTVTGTMKDDAITVKSVKEASAENSSGL
jgi:hypothetical protein